jgi:hypothetical protein
MSVFFHDERISSMMYVVRIEGGAYPQICQCESFGGGDGDGDDDCDDSGDTNGDSDAEGRRAVGGGFMSLKCSVCFKFTCCKQ